MLCPRCKALMKPALESTPQGRIELDYCPACRGIWFDGGELSALLQLPSSEALEQHFVQRQDDQPSMPCPRHRSERMVERSLSTARAADLLSRLPGDVETLRIDQCPACSGVWLDGGELDQLVSALSESAAAPFLINPQELPDRPTSKWVWMFMFLTGLPIEQYHPRSRAPVVVTTLIVLCSLGFLFQLGSRNPSEIIYTYGLVPERWLSGGVWPWLSHMFLHGGLLHLLGNMYFLWVFGDNVEDRLGRWRFIQLYFAAGIGAALLHCLLGGSPEIPVVGASGAISGVMAAYALLFPNARLVSLVFFVVKVRWRATTFLGVWLVLQIIGALRGAPMVAWWAHIGGFAVGALMAWRWRPGAELARRSGRNGRNDAPPNWPPRLPPPPPALPPPPRKLEWS